MDSKEYAKECQDIKEDINAKIAEYAMIKHINDRVGKGYKLFWGNNLKRKKKTAPPKFRAWRKYRSFSYNEEQEGNKTNINMYNGYTYLGTVDLYKYSSDNLTWVGNLEIEPQFRGQGLGRTLFDYCLKKRSKCFVCST